MIFNPTIELAHFSTNFENQIIFLKYLPYKLSGSVSTLSGSFKRKKTQSAIMENSNSELRHGAELQSAHSDCKAPKVQEHLNIARIEADQAHFMEISEVAETAIDYKDSAKEEFSINIQPSVSMESIESTGSTQSASSTISTETAPSTTSDSMESPSNFFVENIIPPSWTIEKRKIDGEYPDGVSKTDALADYDLPNVSSECEQRKNSLNVNARYRQSVNREIELHDPFVEAVQNKYPIDVSYRTNDASISSNKNDERLTKVSLEELNRQSMGSRSKKDCANAFSAYKQIFLHKRVCHQHMHAFCLNNMVNADDQNENEMNQQMSRDCGGPSCGSQENDSDDSMSEYD